MRLLKSSLSIAIALGVVSASPYAVAQSACSSVFQGVHRAELDIADEIEQYAVLIRQNRDAAFNSEQLKRRDQKLNSIFARLADRVSQNTAIRFRELPMQGMTLPTTLVKNVFKDYNPATELILGAQKENVEGRSHSYILVDGKRYDGAAFGDSSWEPRPSNLIIGGMAFRLRGLPTDVVKSLSDALNANPKIVDTNCYTSMLRFLETHSSLKLERPNPGLPILPSEFIASLLNGKLKTADGKSVEVQALNMMPMSFTEIMARFVDYESQTMIPDPKDIFVRLTPQTIDYHAEQGW